KMVGKGEFRDDLYFRINVINIELPPLRQRIEDVPLLVKSFIEKYNIENNRNIKKISVEAMKELEKYDFPGNIRELQNIIQRAIILNENTIIDKEDLIIRKDNKYNIDTMNMENAVINLEKNMIIESLKRSNYSVRKSANKLSISERQLRYKIEKYNIEIL
ncbi:two-component system response regulator, partial [candidate division WOR-3 bacterium]|nr:two-component system response regulator [candidate division WOR-3 bacterium]